MLGPIRKFSTSIYAKVLLAVIIIPFVFWGMGGLSSGNKNIVVVIDKEKYTSQQFTNFINRTATGKVIILCPGCKTKKAMSRHMLQLG